MSDDNELKQAVLDELKWEASVNAAHIGVTTNAGVVTLMGHVESYAEKSAAERAARRVKDVKAVAEEIEVRLPFGIKRGDEEIASAAVNRLTWNVSVPKDAVKVQVEKGWITLTGEVDWHFQQEAAADEVRGLYGVVGVSNLITIKPSANASNIKDDIMVALHRSWFDPKTINVSVQGGKVRLTGTVREWNERDVAGSPSGCRSMYSSQTMDSVTYLRFRSRCTVGQSGSACLSRRRRDLRRFQGSCFAPSAARPGSSAPRPYHRPTPTP